LTATKRRRVRRSEILLIGRGHWRLVDSSQLQIVEAGHDGHCRRRSSDSFSCVAVGKWMQAARHFPPSTRSNNNTRLPRHTPLLVCYFILILLAQGLQGDQKEVRKGAQAPASALFYPLCLSKRPAHATLRGVAATTSTTWRRPFDGHGVWPAPVSAVSMRPAFAATPQPRSHCT